jgi:hypothetical protein
MPGPLQDPRARRRLRNGPPVMRLPAEGRQGSAPEWPLSEASAEELEIWSSLWRTPQSAAWPPGWTRTAARLARMLAEAERPGARASLLSETRQLEAALGLSPVSMARLHWEIEATEPATVTPIAERPRRRLIVAEDGDED